MKEIILGPNIDLHIILNKDYNDCLYRIKSINPIIGHEINSINKQIQ